MVIKALLGVLVLIGTSRAATLQVLGQYTSFLSDGSTSEGLGYYRFPFTAEYLGQSSPVNDYSLTLWYKVNSNPTSQAILHISNTT